MLWRWCAIIDAYSQRRLTNGSDKIITISVIAAHRGKLLNVRHHTNHHPEPTLVKASKKPRSHPDIPSGETAFIQVAFMDENENEGVESTQTAALPADSNLNDTSDP
jgi:hypothetical protein